MHQPHGSLTPPLISVTGLLHEPLRSLLNPVEPAMQKLLLLERLERLLAESRRESAGGAALDRMLERLDITYSTDEAELARLPRTGPAVVVANHPFGLLDGAILASLLARVRPDARILANSLLASVPDLSERCIFVDPFGESGAVAGNAGALRRCVEWLHGGGLLAAFPAGEVAHMNWREGAVTDPEWNPAVARIAQKTGTAVIPVYFGGGNSMAFHLAGAMHPALRTASLPRELLNKRGSRIRVRIGKPVQGAELRSLGDCGEASRYLRCRVYSLAPTTGARRPRAAGKAIAPPQDAARMAQEIAALPTESRLCESGALAVYVARAVQTPAVLTEIGRLREVAFRAAGEGTGQPLDLDRFDRHYLHLVLWNREKDEVAGAYRLGPTPDILPRYGVKGLYTNTLFRFSSGLFERTGPAIELGRSFVRPEYQKQYAPLLMLWKGIVRYVARRPECAVLFGGVSISNDYHPVSRHLMVRFLESYRRDPLAAMVSARNPYRPAGASLNRAPADLDALSGLVSGLEQDGKGVPILVRQYLRSGGRVLAFNVDRKFSSALDALILVDLRNASSAVIDRYAGHSSVNWRCSQGKK